MNEENLAYDAQFADDIIKDENESTENESTENEYDSKREMLDKTSIVKQTWSISEIYQKINSKNLILEPDYQRNEVWHISKQISFIESLFMGIIIPPIYVVEMEGDSILDTKKYEVVDGKQRLSTIKNFLLNKITLDKNYLEYYGDLYHGKNFSQITSQDEKKVNTILSSILDIYVITSNSPAETKYDIFARLNKGAEPLKVNEIRKAIFHSKVTQIVDKYITEIINNKENNYHKLFSPIDIKRFNDYGRFYSSIAFYCNTDIESCIVKNYNSRPKQMIDNVLQSFQKEEISLEEEIIKTLLDNTIELLDLFSDNSNKEYLIDACIPFSISHKDELHSNIDKIINNKDIKATFLKSKTTTSNVNKRVEIIKDLLGGQ